MQSWRSVAAIIVFAAIAFLLVGCGSNTAPATSAPPGPDSLTVNVTAADNAATVFPSAALTLLPSGATGTTNGNGTFTFTGLQSLPTAVQVNPAYQPGYAAAQISLPNAGQTSLTLDVALVPHSAGTVTSISLNPQAQQAEVGSQIQFSATIVTSAGTTGLRPTWFTVGTAGTINPNGVFTTTKIGASTVYAFSGDMFTSTTVTVVAVHGPEILQVLVDPLQLPYGGGQITVTAPVTDPVGLKTVQTLIFHPDGTFTEIPMVLASGTNDTYRAVYTAPKNSNPTYGTQTYEARVRAVDNAGRVTLSAEVAFTVLGPRTPPSSS